MSTNPKEKTLTDKNRQKYDLRIKKTDRALVKALFTLLSQKSFEDITVQAICDSAQIRRATFYTHFSDKYELFGYAVRVTYQTLPSYNSLYTANRTKEIYLKLLSDVIDFITHNLDLVNSFKKSQIVHLMLNIISTEIIKDIAEIASEYNDNRSIDSTITINFYIKGVFGVLQWWVDDNYPVSKDELMDKIGLLLNSI